MNWSSQPFLVHGSGPKPQREEAPALVAGYRGRAMSSPRIETAVEIAVRHGATPDQARRFFARETSVARNRRRRSATFSSTAPFPEISLADPDGWLHGMLAEIAEKAFPASLNPLQVLFDFCDTHDMTIGIGVAATGGVIETASGGFGLVITTGNRIGYYGSVAVGAGWVLEVNASMQLTVIFGGPSAFTGTSLTIGGNLGPSEGPAIGGHLLLDTAGTMIGFVAELGLQIGAPALSAVEATMMVQQTHAQFVRVVPQSLGYAAALSGPMGRGMIGGLPVRKTPSQPAIQPQGWAMRRPVPGARRRIWS